jgi:hypothetical protein
VIAAFDGPGTGLGVGDGLGVGTGVGDGVFPGVGVAVGVGVGVGLELELTEPHPVARVKHKASNRVSRQRNSLPYKCMKTSLGGTGSFMEKEMLSSSTELFAQWRCGALFFYLT